MNDTITAISTPLGEGAIGIIRLSGPASFIITERIFACKRSQECGYPRARYLYYGHIVDYDDLYVDEVLVSFMPAPATYTREDVVEINCHSGIISIRRILNLLLEAGARLAEPGEFTKRAFLNGRIDLSSAEAVIQVIRARSEESLGMAGRVLLGGLHEKIELLRDQINELRAPLEASFDYPDDFLFDPLRVEDLAGNMQLVISQTKDLLEGTNRNRSMHEGVSVAIIGRPNVGKSSLLNRLLRQQKAIVHGMPGTTRDLLEGHFNLGGYPLRLVDTAGIQRTQDPVEQFGIELALAAAKDAQLLLCVLDGSSVLSAEDMEIIASRKEEQGLVIVVNKTDLDTIIDVKQLREISGEASIVSISALEGSGISKLEEVVAGALDRLLGAAGEGDILLNIRQEELIKKALLHLEAALKALGIFPQELVSLELQEAWNSLGEVNGARASEDVLNRVFSQFCLGK